MDAWILPRSLTQATRKRGRKERHKTVNQSLIQKVTFIMVIKLSGPESSHHFFTFANLGNDGKL